MMKYLFTYEQKIKTEIQVPPNSFLLANDWETGTYDVSRYRLSTLSLTK